MLEGSSIDSPRCTNAFWKSKFRKAKIWSIQPRPLLNPACSSLSVESIAFSMRLSSILQNILLGTESRVIPLQLSQLPRSPFFGSANIRPLVQSFGITSCSQIFEKRSVNNLDAVLMSALNSSAWSESIPGAFRFSCFQLPSEPLLYLGGWCLYQDMIQKVVDLLVSLGLAG